MLVDHAGGVDLGHGQVGNVVRVEVADAGDGVAEGAGQSGDLEKRVERSADEDATEHALPPAQLAHQEPLRGRRDRERRVSGGGRGRRVSH